MPSPRKPPPQTSPLRPKPRPSSSRRRWGDVPANWMWSREGTGAPRRPPSQPSGRLLSQPTLGGRWRTTTERTTDGFWLAPNWARTLRTEILRTRQDNRVFFDWVCEVECKNAILVPVPSAHISDQQLRDHFEAQMDDTLAQRCQKDSIISVTDYRT